MEVWRPKILVVDDSQAQLDRVLSVLRDRRREVRAGWEYDVRTATTGKEAYRKVVADPPDLVLLDMGLPDMEGLEVLRRIKALPSEVFIPVIIVSARIDHDTKRRGWAIGASDYLVKPYEDQELLWRCDAMLHIKSLQDQLRATQQKLAEQSITDGLTGLKNRRHFDERLGEEFGRAQRYSDPVSLIMVDLDHFKRVNDQHGHQMGDQVLRGAAACIRASVRDPDICARYGGEEFAVILPKTNLSGALAVAERIWRELGGKVFRQEVAGAGPAAPLELRMTASIGLAVYPSSEITSAALLVKHADEALYAAKASGRNTISIYRAPP